MRQREVRKRMDKGQQTAKERRVRVAVSGRISAGSGVNIGNGAVVAAAVVAFTLLTAFALVGAATIASAQAEGQPPGKQPITLDILDDDALLLISRTDGRDIVHVSGRARIRHKDRTVWTDELEYDEQQSYAVMHGAVELIDDGEDGLNLTAEHLELDLNTEAALARGDVQFVRADTRGNADSLRYGEYSRLRADIEAALAGRPATVAERVLGAIGSFLADDKVLLLEGDIDLIDGERQFRSELVVINTRDDALVSIGRSVATLPGPDEQ